MSRKRRPKPKPSPKVGRGEYRRMQRILRLLAAVQKQGQR